eukprot:4362014-Lingulodinium_polyedra.AAC.1
MQVTADVVADLEAPAMQQGAAPPFGSSSAPRCSNTSGEHNFVSRLVTQVKGARCDQCGVLQARSRRLWHCTDCEATACPGCRRA